MSSFVALTVHQRAAALDVRERLAAVVAALPETPDVVTLSSCHRVELYATLGPGEDPHERVRAVAGAIPSEAQVLAGEAAAAHLFRVTAGLDSAVLGEAQITGQVRRAHEAARRRGVDPTLDRLFQRALAVARELRARTPLGSVGRSVGSLAVEEAVARVADARAATALVLGAGEIGKLAARALAARVGRVVVANRDAERGAALAASIGGAAVGLDALASALDEADVLISAADTRGAILTRALLGARCARGPLVLIDVAVPRSVAEDARSLAGLDYVDVDGIASARAAVPREVVALAERRCAEDAQELMAELRARLAGATISALRLRAEELRRQQLDRALRRLGHLDARDRRVVEGLAASLVGALLHAPTVALRSAPERADDVRALFGIDQDRVQ